MPVITVDKNKCKKDRLCMLDCPMQIITMNKDEGVPESVPYADSVCINCGHCVAICPTGALSLNTMPVDECDEVADSWNPGADVIENYIKSRRSIRRFRKEPVEKEKLERLMRITSYAPSGHNSRPVEWIVYSDRDRIKGLAQHVIDWMNTMKETSPEVAKAMHFDMITKAWDAGMDVVTYSCPVLIIAHGKKANTQTGSGCAIALSHLELAAPSLGLGCCWGGFLTWCAMVYAPLKETLGIPAGNLVQGTMLTGYPLFKYYRAPKRDSVIEWR